MQYNVLVKMTAESANRQKGSALIAILIAALIVAILVVTRFQKKQSEEASQNQPDVRSIEGMQTAVDKVRDAQQAQKERVEEMNRKMVDIDRQ